MRNNQLVVDTKTIGPHSHCSHTLYINLIELHITPRTQAIPRLPCVCHSAAWRGHRENRVSQGGFRSLRHITQLAPQSNFMSKIRVERRRGGRAPPFPPSAAQRARGHGSAPRVGGSDQCTFYRWRGADQSKPTRKRRSEKRGSHNARFSLTDAREKHMGGVRSSGVSPGRETQRQNRSVGVPLRVVLGNALLELRVGGSRVTSHYRNPSEGEGAALWPAFICRCQLN